MIADVAINRPARAKTSALFRYRVPASLCQTIQRGMLVWVPLRHQIVQGVVLELAESSIYDAESLRDISSIVDHEVIIPSTSLQLAHWVASHYLVSLYDVLELLLPPGVSQKSAYTWRVTPEGLQVSLGALPEYERSILYYLRKHGETKESVLQRDLRGSGEKLRESCVLLQGRGLLVRDIAHNRPRVRPRYERFVRCNLTSSDIDDALSSLTRFHKQRAVVEYLRTILSQHNECFQNEPGSTDDDTSPSSILISARDIYASTGTSLSVLTALERKGLFIVERHEVHRNPLLGETIPADHPPPLTPGQRRVWEPISIALDMLRTRASDSSLHEQTETDAALQHDEVAPQATIFLLHGVTGSGKTEIYLRAVARTLRAGYQALVLVPEIALTAQLVRRFAARFPGQLALLHSELSAGERYDEWRRIRRGEAGLIIGSRSAIFAPILKLGLIIVDEEHETSYKQDDAPRYHARDVAMQFGTIAGCVVILGSATPSVESYYAARAGHIRLLTLSERVGTVSSSDGLPHSRILPLPPVQLVDMRQELRDNNRSIFSRSLQHGLNKVLAQGEQAILFLNRRGAASFVMCRDCGHVVQCPSCGLPLVVHYEEESDTGDSDTQTHTLVESQPALQCHSCTHRALIPAFCSECLSPRIKSFGVGTQRVEQEVRQMFPHARPLRWDRDSVTGKGAHSRLLDTFLRGDADVLIGTQMIAKGLDLPRVSLVGVVAADTGLYLPDFRSGERAFQLLTQVAGRAGRRTSGAQVIIQTYTPDHYALRAAQEHDYHAFVVQELGFRRRTGYPPFGRLVRFVYAHESRIATQRYATDLAAKLQAVLTSRGLHDWRVIGPAPAFFQRVRRRWRWHLLLLIPTNQPHFSSTLLSLIEEVGPLYGWTIDVDPMHVL